MSLRAGGTVPPLASRTPAAWAEHALAAPLELLSDHAHLERKAASNALELVTRWPGSGSPPRWVEVLAAIARDETVHLEAVAARLVARGGGLARVHRNAYASGLRALVRHGQGQFELLDRLLVAALIEARSCERFELLADCPAADAELAGFYRSLMASERGHHRAFLELAELLVPPAAVAARWQELAAAEAQLLAAEPPGPRMHSGVAGLAAPLTAVAMGAPTALRGSARRG